MTRSTVSD
jgi:hypothetical protein